MNLQIMSSFGAVIDSNKILHKITENLSQITDFSQTTSNMFPCTAMVDCANSYNNLVRIICSAIDSDLNNVERIANTFTKQDDYLSGVFNE